MDIDAINFNQPTGPRPPDRRAMLWDELEHLHAQLGIEPPTATYTLEALEEEVALARRAVQQPAVPGQIQFDSIPFDAPPEGGDQRSRKTWRNFYARIFLPEQLKPEPFVMDTPIPFPPEQPIPEPYMNTPSED
jgi:hypothetical protein